MKPLRVQLFGAHPDDTDIKCGGVAALYRQAGAVVQMVSITDGRSGHHRQSGRSLVVRRRAEARAAGAVLGIEYLTLNFPDAALYPTLAARHELIRRIRKFSPDVIMVHRPNDYHPDHRAASQLVQDAAYLLTVPSVVRDSRALSQSPAIFYYADGFTKPSSFQPDIIVPIDDVIDRKFAALSCHESQVYEWLPYNRGRAHNVPMSAAARKRWLYREWDGEFRCIAKRYRRLLMKQFGAALGKRIKYAEAFEISEYGAAVRGRDLQRLFPFLGMRTQVK